MCVGSDRLHWIDRDELGSSEWTDGWIGGFFVVVVVVVNIKLYTIIMSLCTSFG